MDIVLHYCDHYILTPFVYPTTWKETDAPRQIISLLFIINIGGYILYFLLAAFSYFYIFDRRLLKHPLILENQIQKEIMVTVKSVPLMSIPTACLFFLEIRGYSKLYDNAADTLMGWPGVVASVFTFILFTDMCIYWIHRFLHHKMVYKHLHKLHHKWKVPTPFASHAFHPVDGFVQSVPYHIYPFLFPLHKGLYLGLFIFVNFWTVSIHDGDYRVPDVIKPFVNGSAHHTDHHLFYSFNYGQFFTLWDRIGGSFRNPSSFKGQGPVDLMLKEEEEKEKEDRRNGKVKTNGNGNTENEFVVGENGVYSNGVQSKKRD